MADSVVEVIKTTFRFLEAEYGFGTVTSREDQGKPYLGGWVEYASSATLVSIVVERLEIVLPPYVARASDRGRFKGDGRIELDRICEFALTTPPARLRLASRDLEELRIAWKEVVEPIRVDQASLGAEESLVDIRARLESELSAYAQLLSKCGEPYLRGDFTSWLELHEYRWNWLVANQIVHNMRWGEALTVENAEARLEGSRAYLEHLRREVGQD